MKVENEMFVVALSTGCKAVSESGYVSLRVLQHLRVRCSAGTEFHTRCSTKVRGRMGHRFMFIDGDKAVSGSYRSVKVYVCLSMRV